MTADTDAPAIVTDQQREVAISFALKLLHRAGIRATVQTKDNGNMVVTIQRPWAKPRGGKRKGGKSATGRRYAA